MINILMCTYNGDRYLREQLDSIIAQTYTDWRLYIRDDGSTDNTEAIIREYVMAYKSKIVELEALEHLGYPDCFWDILKRCPDAEYYAFCDQDDVWSDTKLESAYNRLLSQSCDEMPVLYIHDYENCDNNLNVMSVHKLGSVDILTDRSILFYTYASGFCMMINNAMRNLINTLPIMNNAMYHDELCIWLAHFYGKIVYDDTILTRYRRHEKTFTEYGNGLGTLISNWLRREIKRNEFDDKCNRIQMFIDFSKYMDKECISAETRDEWILLSRSGMDTAGYLRRLFYRRRLKPSIGGELALRLIFLLNKGSYQVS